MKFLTEKEARKLAQGLGLEFLLVRNSEEKIYISTMNSGLEVGLYILPDGRIEKRYLDSKGEEVVETL